LFYAYSEIVATSSCNITLQEIQTYTKSQGITKIRTKKKHKPFHYHRPTLLKQKLVKNMCSWKSYRYK